MRRVARAQPSHQLRQAWAGVKVGSLPPTLDASLGRREGWPFKVKGEHALLPTLPGQALSAARSFSPQPCRRGQYGSTHWPPKTWPGAGHCRA